MKKIDAICNQECIATPKENYDTELLKYQWAGMENPKENYYTELCNNKTNFNDNKNTPLSSVSIQESTLRVMIKYREGEITDDKNVTSDMCILASSSQRENSNVIFAIEKLENSGHLVDALENMTINDIGYELNTETASETQVKFVSNPDKIIHTSNKYTHQKMLRSWTIGICNKDISVLEPPIDTNIGAKNQTALLISTGGVQAPQHSSRLRCKNHH